MHLTPLASADVPGSETDAAGSALVSASSVLVAPTVPAYLDAPATPDEPHAVLPSPRQTLLRAASRHPGLLCGAAVILLAAFAAAFAPWLAGHDPYAQDLSQRLIDPVWGANGSWSHPFGTDALGRDQWSRLLHGARVSLAVGFGAAAISALIGGSLGLIGGYFGGRIDTAVLYLINVKLALPPILVALCVIAVVGGSVPVLIAVLGFLFWDRFAVVLRSLTSQLRGSQFITAAQAAGASQTRIVLGELLPNLVGQIVVIASLDVSLAISVEAVLSFLGLGVKPPDPSWGLMVADGRALMFFKPYLAFVPGAALFVLVLGINLFGDGVRDIATPHRDA